MKKIFLIFLILPYFAFAYTMSSIDCLAINSYHEANTATLKEKELINDVVINRALLQNKTTCQIVFAKNQFSWTNQYGRRLKFKSQKDALSHYGVNDSSYPDLYKISLDSVLSHSLINYKPITNYHDKSIKGFSGLSQPKKMVKVLQTKNFVFYADRDYYEKNLNKRNQS